MPIPRVRVAEIRRGAGLPVTRPPQIGQEAMGYSGPGFRRMGSRMARKRHTAEEIIGRLRAVEVGLASGQNALAACRQAA